MIHVVCEILELLVWWNGMAALGSGEMIVKDAEECAVVDRMFHFGDELALPGDMSKYGVLDE